MSYWYWSGGVALLGLALGVLLFAIAYWSGKRKGRRARQRRDDEAAPADKKEPPALVG